MPFSSKGSTKLFEKKLHKISLLKHHQSLSLSRGSNTYDGHNELLE